MNFEFISENWCRTQKQAESDPGSIKFLIKIYHIIDLRTKNVNRGFTMGQNFDLLTNFWMLDF
jgi:hypothetical protein